MKGNVISMNLLVLDNQENLKTLLIHFYKIIMDLWMVKIP